jgi:hypothetical protein
MFDENKINTHVRHQRNQAWIRGFMSAADAPAQFLRQWPVESLHSIDMTWFTKPLILLTLKTIVVKT